MRPVTIDDVMVAGPEGRPCKDYSRERVKELFAGCETLTASDILTLDIPHNDRWWALCYTGVLDDGELREIACRAVERIALPIFEAQFPDDNRPRKCIETVRAQARGGATRKRVEEARDATWAVADLAAWTPGVVAWAVRAANRAANRAEWGQVMDIVAEFIEEGRNDN